MPGPPTNPFSGIFVCYRRDDSAGHAGRLFDRLNAHFGDAQIFMDIDTIKPGEDFIQVIENAVGSCEILIAVIGRRWLSSADKTSRRLDNPNDFVRLEIAAALNRDIGIIPVLVQGSSMPEPQDLPDDLSRLSRHHAFDLSDVRWRRDVDILISALERTLKQRAEARQRKVLAEEEERRVADAQRQEEARLRDEAEARIKAAVEEAARRRAEAEARLAEFKARLQAENEASARAEEEARKLAEEARAMSGEKAGRLAEVEALLKEQLARLQAEGLASARAEVEEQRLAAEVSLQEEASRFPSLEDVDAGAEEESFGFRVISDSEEDVSWVEPAEDDAIIPAELLQRLASVRSDERAEALAEVVVIGGDDAFRRISKAFDDQVVEVRNAAARALFNLQPDSAATFTRALREGSPQRRRRIGQAIAGSGLAAEAVANMTGESREKTYDAFSLLFLMSKSGEVQPLMQVIEDYPNIEVRIAVVKLLALSGQPEIIPAFRRLAVRGSTPGEVRSSLMEAIYQISSKAREAYNAG